MRVPSAGYEAVVRLVGERTGLVFGRALREGAETRIRREMSARSIGEVEDYVRVLDADPAMFDALVAELTVGETYFFRDPAQFAQLRSHVVPGLLRGRGHGGPLRVWSAGCATGEEAYSLAILLRELGVADAATVIGTDLSLPRLQRARAASYSRWSLRGVPEAVVRTYFRYRGGRYRLVPEIRAAVRFRRLNLAEASYPSLASGIGEMDLVLCRNVLIYLDPDTVIQVARRLVDSLSADGWLLLGASDPPLAGRIPCEAVVTEAGLAYRRPARRASGWPVVERSAAPVERARPASGDGEPERSARPTRALDGPGPGPLERRPDRAPPADPAEAAACYAARDYARAAELASAVLERDGGEPHLWALGVRALANQGRLAEAGRLCSAALDRHRVSAELMCLHSTLLAAAGHHAEAAAAARRAVYLDREMAMAHVALGSALSSRGERAGAGRALRCAERLLLALSATEPVPGSDGEPAGSLLEMVRLKLKLLGTAA